MKKLFTLLMVLFSISYVKAQQSFTIATDFLTIAVLNGYELEAGYSTNKNRFSISYLDAELTPWYGQASDFKTTSHSVLDIGYSRWLTDGQRGFSYGVSYTYFTSFEVENNDREKLDKNPSKISLRLTYAWYPFKNINLFLEPVMNFGFMLNDEDLNFASGEQFNKKSFIGNGPLFNIGYKYNFN